MENKVFTVSAINNYVKQVIENDFNLFNIAVEGKISNLTIHSTGHIYFTIKDNASVLKAVMFAFSAKKLTFQLKEGIKIISIGSIKIYEPQGTYSLQVVNIKLDGIGESRYAMRVWDQFSHKNYIGHFCCTFTPTPPPFRGVAY